MCEQISFDVDDNQQVASQNKMEQQFSEAKDNSQANVETDIDNEDEGATNTKGIDLLENYANGFDHELFIEFLNILYPTIKDDIKYCAPEMIWIKIKEITGLDIEDVTNTFYKYHNNECRHCEEKKTLLKRKFLDTIYSEK